VSLAFPPQDVRSTRILVAGVGNVLRGDDGFGPAVVARLGEMPPGVRVIETGIGGVALLQELLAGPLEGLLVVDAMDRHAAPGTVFLFEPDVVETEHVADVHLANPERVLSMALSMGALPPRVAIVGCQPEDADELGESLTPVVERAIPSAVLLIRTTLQEWLEA
jgi:hydrogenase maturation protease